MSDLAITMTVRTEEAAVVAELKAGSEEAFSWLITHYHQPVYSLVYRLLDDPSDAADTTQDVFLKVFRAIGKFKADSSLKTWIYRIAIHEASNHRRWWFRHKFRETSIEPLAAAGDDQLWLGIKDTLADKAKTPFENVFDGELRSCVEGELKALPEPYRATVILRDIEELSYEEIAEVTGTSLGTVKSRLVRGREALRKRLERHLPELGLNFGTPSGAKQRKSGPIGGQEVEVMP